MSIAYDLLKYLENEGIGTENLDLFIGFMPDTPFNCISFYDESATTPPESANLAVDVLGVQIISRNSNYHTAGQKLKDIHKFIVGFGGSSLIAGGDVVSYITVETAPFSIGKDENGNNQWTVHYNIRVQSSNDEYRT
jgi:hypothetical protein